MTPVIRIDDQVMSELRKQAIALNQVFGTPNEVLRIILGLDRKGNIEHIESTGNSIDIDLDAGSCKYNLIRVSKPKRLFFPGYKMPFEMVTDVETITTHITSAPKGTPRGDPRGGSYIRKGLLRWYRSHPELKDGSKLRVEAIEPGKRYRLSVAQS
ncbi:MAG: hypothetical protein WC749_13005 [Dehalococcoidia bacterium]